MKKGKLLMFLAALGLMTSAFVGCGVQETSSSDNPSTQSSSIAEESNSQEMSNQESESQSSETQDSDSQGSENQDSGSQDSGSQDSGDQEVTYTVTFKDGNKVETITVKEGEKATLPAWTKEGYTLSWDADLTNVAITENKTVNAVWTVNAYSAKIVRADGTEETVDFTIENRANKLAAIALTENNAQYSYAWSANLPTELALNNNQVFTETRTVNQYTITFNTDGGTAITAVTVDYGTPATLLDTYTSTLAGYTFAGWTYENGEEIPADATVTGNVTVKASWTANAVELFDFESEDQLRKVNSNGQVAIVNVEDEVAAGTLALKDGLDLGDKILKISGSSEDPTMSFDFGTTYPAGTKLSFTVYVHNTNGANESGWFTFNYPGYESDIGDQGSIYWGNRTPFYSYWKTYTMTLTQDTRVLSFAAKTGMGWADGNVNPANLILYIDNVKVLSEYTIKVLLDGEESETITEWGDPNAFIDLTNYAETKKPAGYELDIDNSTLTGYNTNSLELVLAYNKIPAKTEFTFESNDELRYVTGAEMKDIELVANDGTSVTQHANGGNYLLKGKPTGNMATFKIGFGKVLPKGTVIKYSLFVANEDSNCWGWFPVVVNGKNQSSSYAYWVNSGYWSAKWSERTWTLQSDADYLEICCNFGEFYKDGGNALDLNKLTVYLDNVEIAKEYSSFDFEDAAQLKNVSGNGTKEIINVADEVASGTLALKDGLELGESALKVSACSGEPTITFDFGKTYAAGTTITLDVYVYNTNAANENGWFTFSCPGYESNYGDMKTVYWSNGDSGFRSHWKPLTITLTQATSKLTIVAKTGMGWADCNINTANLVFYVDNVQVVEE